MTIALATIAVLAVVGSADAAIYWSDVGEVDRANNDGSLFTEHWIEPNRTTSPARAGGTAGVRGCEGIAVDSSHLYFADPRHGAIERADLNGGTEAAFITGLENPCGVAVDSSHVYWADVEARTIGIANLDGSEVQREFITGAGEPCGVAVGGGYLYWSAKPTYKEVEEGPEGRGADDYIARVPLAGGIKERIFESNQGLCGLAIDATHLYWGGFGTTIGRAGLDGSAPEPTFISGIDRPCGVALYGSQIFWSRNDPSDPAILTAPLGEPGSIRPVVAPGLGTPCGLAVDSVQIQPAPPPSPAPAPPLSHVVSFGHQRHGSGPVTFVTAKFPQAGTFTVEGGPALRVRSIAPGHSAYVLLGPEERVLRISPKRVGRAAKALRAKLANRGTVQIALRLHFVAADGTTFDKREPLSLDGPPHRPSVPRS